MSQFLGNFGKLLILKGKFIVFWHLTWISLYTVQKICTVLVKIMSFLNSGYSSRVNERYSFEIKNQTEKEISKNVRHAFHVSSEGELSQIYPLLEEVVNRRQVLLIFTSPSLENRVQYIKKQLGPNLFIRRISFFTNSDLLSLRDQLESLSLCRYDFLPELMLLGLRSKKFYVLNATSVKWRSAWSARKLFVRAFYEQFDLITTSNTKDFNAFGNIFNGPVINLNLRTLEVKKDKSLLLN